MGEGTSENKDEVKCFIPATYIGLDEMIIVWKTIAMTPKVLRD